MKVKNYLKAIMRIGFWNLQSANPMLMAHTGERGGQIQVSLVNLACDVVILCEVGDVGIECAEIAAFKFNAMLEVASEEFGLVMPSTKLPKQGVAKYKEGALAIGLEKSRSFRKASHRFSKSDNAIRGNAASMATIRRANDYLERHAAKQAIANRDHPTIQQRLKTAPVSDLMRRYKRYHIFNSQQQDRNYLIFSDKAFSLTQIEVVVAGAKRSIIRLEFSGFVILSVHAPAYGKGGGETMIQISDLVAKEKLPCMVIGDMNIDCEELALEISENPSKFPQFTGGQVKCFTPPKAGAKAFKRKWHPKRGEFHKVIEATHQSGGSLDYVAAKSDMDMKVTVEIKPTNFSDHGAIVATWEAPDEKSKPAAAAAAASSH